MTRTRAPKICCIFNHLEASISPNTQASHIRISEGGAEASVLVKTPQSHQVCESLNQESRKLQGGTEGDEV